MLPKLFILNYLENLDIEHEINLSLKKQFQFFS